MGGPKILVFHIRQLLKTGIFVLIGLIIIILLVWVLIPKNKGNGGAESSLALDSSLYIPGTYGSQIILQNNPIDVFVTVSGDKITDIQLLNMNETQEVLYPLLKPTMETLAGAIIKYQTTNVETDAGNAVTGQILLDAINLALAQAYANTIDTGVQ